MNAKYIIRFDDFYDGMDIEKYSIITEWLIKFKIPAIIGVVPAWEENSFGNTSAKHHSNSKHNTTIDREKFFLKMREVQSSGCEIALHGYSHKLHPCKSILNVNQYGEFPGLTFDEQKNKIALGKKCFEEQGLACRVFMAPAHSFDKETLRALRSENIPIITDGKALYPYQTEGMTFIPQISSSPTTYPFGIITICLHPQYLSAAGFDKLRRFVIEQDDSIVSVEYALEYLKKMGYWARLLNKIILFTYKPYKSIKSASRYLRTPLRFA